MRVDPSYTRTPAWQDHAADWKGTLAEGMVADICVVGGDVLAVNPHELVNLPVNTTVLGGQVVHERTETRKPSPSQPPSAA